MRKLALTDRARGWLLRAQCRCFIGSDPSRVIEGARKIVRLFFSLWVTEHTVGILGNCPDTSKKQL